MSDAHSYARQDFDPILNEIITGWSDLSDAAREIVLDTFRKVRAQGQTADAIIGLDGP